ncbi:cellulase family glycosylhydrolase [Halocatena halophila]|uniref:cellulase family glycosylhydrolase n=1 Tax=Halocatena halophila TaxID=2814576 RepID=UPI002ED22722
MTQQEDTTNCIANPVPETHSEPRVSRRHTLCAIGMVAGSLVTGRASAGVPTPRLHTDGRWLRDPNGNTVQLRGMATADPGFYRRFHPKSFQEVLQWATDESNGWYPNVVRLPITQDSVAHFGITTLIEEIIRPAVNELTARDVYALIDFHLIRPYTQPATETYNEENDENLLPIDDVMTTFWSAVAPEFADDEHVLFELFNEPTQPAMYGDDAGAWQTWRDAAQPWVDLIRTFAPSTPIIIGSPRWTSVTHMAPEFPFSGENLLYAGHIYPANGAPSSFDQYYGTPALDVPVVITEFGWDPAGGSVDQGTTEDWGEPFRQWAESYQNMGWISWCFDDSWAPTFFDSPDAGANEPWTLKTDSSQMGGYVKSWLADRRNDSIPESPIDDSQSPPTPPNLTVTQATDQSIELSWESVTDRGDAGLSHYVVSVDGSSVVAVPSGTTMATVTDLAPDTTYEVGVIAVDQADNASTPARITTTTPGDDGDGTEPPPDALVVDNYDGDPGWSSNRNDLGEWCGAGSFANGSGIESDGALTLAYDNGGWFQTQLNRDISEYATLVIRVRGANGGEENDISFDMGGVRTLLANVTDDSIGTTVSDLTIDLTEAGVDRTDPSSSLRLSFWQGGNSTLTIQSIHLS